MSKLARFDYERLNLNPETIIPTADDLKLIHNLNRLDKYIARSADYNEYEELLWDVQIGFSERFHLWLTNNGIEEALEYTLVPTAMRLLYIFLYEKGYLLEPPDRMIDFIDKLEPEFIENLKERFS